jgi:hypothetical protein
MGILSHNSPLAFDSNILFAIVLFSIPCTVAFIYGYLMTFKTDKYLKEKEFNLGYWLHNNSPNIAPRLRRMAQLDLWQNQHSPDPRPKTRRLGIFLLCASVMVEICIITISLIAL